jgi:hypothetical protein
MPKIQKMELDLSTLVAICVVAGMISDMEPGYLTWKNLQYQWEHGRSDLRKGTSINIPTVESAKQHHGVWWTDSHASLACTLKTNNVIGRQ